MLIDSNQIKVNLAVAMENQLTVFIDEGGDAGVRDGLDYAHTRHEWFSIGALIIRSSRELEAVKWVQHIRDQCRSSQSPDLHYHKLKEDRRVQACEILSKRPAKALCVVSHKSNVRAHVSPKLGKLKAMQYYNWCTRLLLERVMFWAAEFYISQDAPIQPLRIIFSENRGHNYEEMFGYFETLNMQAELGRFKLKPKAWIPAMMVRDFWAVQPHNKIAGLQLADLVASAFLQAANSNSNNFNQSAAEALKKIMASSKNGDFADVGVTVWPLRDQAPVPVAARPIFQHYGYVF